MIFFKSEANEEIGGGHLTRSLTLAREFVKAGIQIGFVFAKSSDTAISRTAEEGYEVYRVNEEDEYSASAYLTFLPNNSMIVFDTDDPAFYSGYLIDELRKNNIKTACFTISDEHFYTTDLIVNPNLIAKKQTFRRASHSELLAGPEFMIFREEFRNISCKRMSKSIIENLILIFGNSDANHLTSYFLDVVNPFAYLFKKVIVIIGSLNPDRLKIEKKANSIHDINLDIHVDAKNMKDIYSSVDVAITAAGMAMWELALFSIPQLVVASSRREAGYAEYLDELNYIVKLGDYSNLPEVSKMSSDLENILRSGKLGSLKTEEFCNTINPNGVEKIMDHLAKMVSL